MYRPVTTAKLEVFEKLYQDAYQRFSRNENNMKLMAGSTAKKQNAQTAALVVVAGAMMNLDEFITKN